MALILKDRVKESSSSSGTGSITLGGAFPGYQTFNAAVATGSTVYYTIHNLTAGDDDEWEVGVGTFTSPATLSRDTVLSSSAGAPTKTNFTAGASGLEVFVTQPAEEAVYLNNATGLVEIGGNGTNTVSFTNVNTTNLTATTVTLTNGTISANAANATDIVNKTYVDNLVLSGTHFHEPVLVEEDIALDAVYVQPNGASNGVGATLTNNAANAALVVDGVSVSNTARILVYAQANAVQNGVYTVTNPGNASAQWVLTRSTDTDTFGLASSTELSEGSTFFVSSGNTGAGRTYTCNTQGTITFGTTNITFAQISSSQIYAAGTGLNLANLTFSISNTAVTAAQYGNDGAVGQFTVNAQGQLTNAANVSINASSISVGTLANGRTTAASANGASTIVLRDSNGDFTANTITATTSNATTFNGTTGSFTNVSGNGVALTAINASNISSGTIANARTTGNTANSASTIVLRDANGSFGANIISGAFSGDGSAINAINASNISSGTIANARTSAASANGASTIVLRDGSGGFGAGDITAVSISGNGVALTAINASNITSGTINNARTSASSSNGASSIVLRGASGEFAAGAITGTSFSGNGSALTAINASSITTGTLDNARTTAASANGASTIVARDASGNAAFNGVTALAITAGGGTAQTRRSVFTANTENFAAYLQHNAATNGVYIGATSTANTFVVSNAGGSAMLTVDGSGNGTFNGTIAGNGAPLTAINASNISSGTIANARTTAATANGASTIVLRGTSGEFSAGIITADGSGLSAINASNIASGTIANARTTAATANGASTIVARDANGSFAGNVVTATTGTFTSVSGNGVALTAINASNISSGTVANARTTAATANGASTIVLRGTSGEFTAGAITGASFTGNGVALTAINASNIASGTIATARLGTGTANSATFLRGDQTYAAVPSPNNGTLTMNVSGTGLSGSASFTADQAGASTFTVTSNGSSANGASTLVARDGSGDFAARTITATLTGTASALVTGTNYQVGGLGIGTAGAAGELRATGNVTAFYSDERLKTKTGDIKNALDKVCQIETLLYHANKVAVALGYDASIPEVGVTAQSVQKVQPEIVVPAPIDAKYLTVRYEKLVPLLIEAIKELKAEVDALKGK